MAYDLAALQERVQEYTRKAKVLRQIQSGKLAKSERKDAVLNYSTIIVSAVILVLTFFGVKNLHHLFFHHSISLEVLDFIFNLFVLLLFIAAILQMTLNLKEKSLSHLRAIRELTDLLTLLDDISRASNLTNADCERQIDRLNDRYRAINLILPTNTDAEWIEAKRQLERKG